MAKITSTFSRNTDGWTMSGDVASFEWQPDGGAKGGAIFWSDAASGSDSYWVAPTKFTGDLSAYWRGRFSFDWFSTADNYDTGDVILTGANGTVLVADATNPGTDWTHAEIKLNAASWHVGAIDGPIATNRQLKDVLADVADLRIRAEHVYGGESGGLDAVKLTSSDKLAMATAFGADRHADMYGAPFGAPPHLDTSLLALA